MDKQSNHKLYIANKNKMNFSNHNNKAKSLNANLVSMHDEKSYDYVHKFGKQAFKNDTRNYFIGGQRKSNKNGKDDCCWKWTDGSNWDYHKWYGREPNNWRNIEDVVNMYTHVNGMNDIASSHVTNAIYYQNIPSVDTIQIPNDNDSSIPLIYKSDMFDHILGSDHYDLNFTVSIKSDSNNTHYSRNIFTYGTTELRSPALWINRNNSWHWHLSFLKDPNLKLQPRWKNWRDKVSNIEIHVPESLRSFNRDLNVKISMKKTSKNSFEVHCTINGQPAIKPTGQNKLVKSIEATTANYHKTNELFQIKRTHSSKYPQELLRTFSVSNFQLKKLPAENPNFKQIQGFANQMQMEGMQIYEGMQNDNKARLYIANRHAKSWSEHNEIAKSNNAHMVSITNKEQNDYISKFGKKSFGNTGFFIGGERHGVQPTANEIKNTYDCQSYIDRYPDLQNYYTSCQFKIDGDCQQHPEMSNKDWFNDSEYGGPQGYPSEYITKEMCNARKQHWIKSCRSKGGSKDSEQNVTYDTKVIDDILAQDVWEMSMDISISESSKRWRNIFHYGNANWIRAPAMWLWPNYRNNEEDVWRLHLILRLVNTEGLTGRAKWLKYYNHQINFYVPKELRNFGETFNVRIQYRENESQSLAKVVIFINDVEQGLGHVIKDTVFERKTNQEFGIKKTWGWYTDVDSYTVNNFDMKKVASNIYVGNSGTNVKPITLPANDMQVSNQPMNPQNPVWSDKFKVSTSGNEVDVQRTDATGGWGQKLTLRADFPENPVPPKISMRYKDGKDCSVQSTSKGALDHWETYGKKEGRNPSKPQFDFLFNGCPRQTTDIRWLENAGKNETYISCATKCENNQECNMFEINGCGGNNHHPNCKGTCRLYKGNVDSVYVGDECNKNGNTKTFKRINYGDNKLYKWTDGSDWEFMNWYQGQPDNWEKKEDKVMMLYSNGKWNDINANAKLPSMYYKEIWNPNEIVLPEDSSSDKHFLYRSPQFDDIFNSNNFEIEFKITIDNNQRSWRNIFHYGNTNVIRSPSMFIYPNNAWQFLYGVQKAKSWMGWRKSHNYYKISVPEASRKFGQTMLVKVQWTSSKSKENPITILINGEKALIEIFNDTGSWGNLLPPEESDQDKEFYNKEGQLFKLKFGHNKQGYDINNVYLRKLDSDTIIQQESKTNTDNFSTQTIENMNYSLIEGNTSYNLATKQNEVLNIMDSEVRRVESKKAELDGVMFSQKRELELNESHRQRHRYYIYMLLILVVAIVAFVIIARMREMITFVPEFVYDLMVVLIIVIPGFLIYFAYLDIQRRDHMDFSKVQLAQPREESGEEKDKRQASYVEEGDLSAIGKLCKGQDCCPDETKDQTGVAWDSSVGKCMPYSSS